jgi:hypothetical protein
MPGIAILHPVIRKSVSVNFSIRKGATAAKAILLGASGERLHTYPLPAEENELSLDGFAAGAYTLRIEAGNEVVVEQIIIPS